jgi:hypothetical protein
MIAVLTPDSAARAETTDQVEIFTAIPDRKPLTRERERNTQEPDEQ